MRSKTLKILFILLLITLALILSFYFNKTNITDIKTGKEAINPEKIPYLENFNYTIEPDGKYINIMSNIGCKRVEKYVLTNFENVFGCFTYKSELLDLNENVCVSAEVNKICVKANSSIVINIGLNYNSCDKSQFACPNNIESYVLKPLIIEVPRVTRA